MIPGSPLNIIFCFRNTFHEQFLKTNITRKQKRSHLQVESYKMARSKWLKTRRRYFNFFPLWCEFSISTAHDHIMVWVMSFDSLQPGRQSFRSKNQWLGCLRFCGFPSLSTLQIASSTLQIVSNTLHIVSGMLLILLYRVLGELCPGQLDPLGSTIRGPTVQGPICLDLLKQLTF